MSKQSNLKQLLSKIEDLNTLCELEECIELMKDIVMEDDNISQHTKSKYVFLYLQCMQYVALQKVKVAQVSYSSCINKAIRKIFGKNM